jgi:hypothetical protein
MISSLAESLFHTAAGAAATAPMLELGLRKLGRRTGAHYAWHPNLKINFEIDPVALPHVIGPGTITTNSIGERGSSLPATSSEKAFRVLVVGGSAAEGYVIRDEEYWPNVVQRLLSQDCFLANAGVDTVRVGSIAKSLSPIRVHGPALQKIQHRYKSLDAIVALFGASDLVEWVENKCQILPHDQLGDFRQFFQLNTLPPFGWGMKTSALFKYSRVAHAKLFQSKVHKAPIGTNLSELRRKRANARQIIEALPDMSALLVNIKKDMEEFLRIAQGLAPRVIVLEQPWFDRSPNAVEEAMMWHFSYGNPRLGSPDAYFAHSAASDGLRVIADTIAEVTTRSGATWVPVRKSVEPSLSNYYDYLHPTNEGSIKIAQVCANAFNQACIRSRIAA